MQSYSYAHARRIASPSDEPSTIMHVQGLVFATRFLPDAVYWMDYKSSSGLMGFVVFVTAKGVEKTENRKAAGQEVDDSLVEVPDIVLQNAPLGIPLRRDR